ncbi:MAG: hypothetical protein R3F42_08995 [Pseudomonadota bacterium]
MNELLGLYVLAGPLLLLLWVPIALLIAFAIPKRSSRRGSRFLTGLIAFLVLLFLPLADEIAGRIYLKYLCSTQGGFKVYRTVELPDEYWDEDGDPRFIKFTESKIIPSLNRVDGTLNLDVLTDYGKERTGWKPYSNILSISQSRYWYYEKKTGDILAENKNYSRRCGRILRIFPAGSCGESCVYADRINTKQKILSVFVPVKK